MEIPPGDPGHGHFHIGIRDDAPLKTGVDPLQITAVQHHVGLVFLRPHVQLLPVLGHQHGIGQPGHLHQLVKVFRRDAGQLAVLGEGIGIPVGLPRHRDALLPGLHRRDVVFFPLAEIQLARRQPGIVLRIESLFPALFADVHLPDAVVDLVQQGGVAFAHHNIERFFRKLCKDALLLALAQGAGHDHIHFPALQGSGQFFLGGVIPAAVAKALPLRKLGKCPVAAVADQPPHGLPIEGRQFLCLKAFVVAPGTDLHLAGADGVGKIKFPLPCRRLAGRGHKVDLPLCQHGFQLVPAVAAFHIPIVQVGILLQQIEKIHTVAAPSAILQLLIARILEIADLHRLHRRIFQIGAAVFHIHRRRNRLCIRCHAPYAAEQHQHRQHQRGRRPSVSVFFAPLHFIPLLCRRIFCGFHTALL